MKNGGSFHSYVSHYQRVLKKPPNLQPISSSNLLKVSDPSSPFIPSEFNTTRKSPFLIGESSNDMDNVHQFSMANVKLSKGITNEIIIFLVI